MSRDVLMLLFKLRNNIVLEGDVGLAERELQSLLGQAVQPVYTDDMKQWESAQWVLPKDIELRRGGVAGYLCTAEAADLTRLFWRLSFCEQVFGVAPNTEYIRELLSRLPASFVRCRVIRGRLTFMFVPFSAVAEWSDVVARRARSPSEVEASLDYLCKAIVSEQPTTLPQTLRGVLAAKQTTGHLFHGLHVYKAKFFPRMARAFLNLCGGTTVLDPFAGSGTALIEASVMGIPSVGIDIDPLSVAITQAKASLLANPGDYLEKIGEVQRRIESLDKGQGSLFEMAETPALYSITPAFLRRRVPEPILREVEADVAHILRALRGLPSCSPLHVALSDALSRKFKFRFLGLGYGRFSLTILPRRVRLIFADNLSYLAKAIVAWQWLRRRTGVSPAPIQTVRGDARSLPLEAQSIDCVVTSPPYMPASSGRENYLKSKAYAMTALGLVAPDSVDALEAELIGSVQRTEPINDLPADAVKLVEWMQSDPTRCVKAAATARYFADIRESLREIRRVLKPNGKCAYVVAQRHVFYRYKSREVVRVVENADIIAELARQAGLEVQELIHVELQKQNTIARPRSLDAYYETIVLLEKR
ncbi:MAG: hypothetical protein NZ874_09655 [Fimbriimonadales bacterium]|nr:hypothetical protein [Fimbriimonadales bacterium]